MRYCGVVAGPRWQVLCALEEVLTDVPPVRLAARFYEPGSPEQVAAEIAGLGDVVVAIAAPLSAVDPEGPGRRCDAELRRRGVAPAAAVASAVRLRELLGGRGVFEPDEDGPQGRVGEGAYRHAAVFETNADAVFCALQGTRVPARRHPTGIQLRIEELETEHVDDEGGGFWARRIEEIDAAAAALCAHRYAVGHAAWVGDPDEGVVVLPGLSVPESFSEEGVLPPVARVPLPASGQEGR